MNKILLSIAFISLMLFSTNLFSQERPIITIIPNNNGVVIVTCHFPPWGLDDWTETVLTMAAANVLIDQCNTEGGTVWVENRLR